MTDYAKHGSGAIHPRLFEVRKLCSKSRGVPFPKIIDVPGVIICQPKGQTFSRSFLLVLPPADLSFMMAPRVCPTQKNIISSEKAYPTQDEKKKPKRDHPSRIWVSLIQEKGVGVINASPLSMGLLTEQGPPTWHPASDEIKVRAEFPSMATYHILMEFFALLKETECSVIREDVSDRKQSARLSQMLWKRQREYALRRVSTGHIVGPNDSENIAWPIIQANQKPLRACDNRLPLKPADRKEWRFA